MNLSNKLKELRHIAEMATPLVHYKRISFHDKIFYEACTPETIIEMCNCIQEMQEALEFTLRAAEHLFKPEKELPKGLDPMFYHTLDYAGDLELINKTKKAKEVLNKYFGE